MTSESLNIKQIESRIYDLSDQKFRELVDFVQRARDSRSAAQFVDETLAALRPRLRLSRPPRRLNVERIFARPFEDLLHDGPIGSDRLGRIARRAIMPCWTIVARSADPNALNAVTEDIRGLVTDSADWPTKFGPRVWAIAGASLCDILRADPESC